MVVAGEGRPDDARFHRRQPHTLRLRYTDIDRKDKGLGVESLYAGQKVMENEWLFMAYHAFDFFFVVDDLPKLADFQQATVDNIVACAIAAPENQYDSLFAFAPAPDSMIARALPDGLLDRCLDSLADAQQDEGHWLDQHNLPQWYPMTTINVLLALKRYGRWS